MISFHHSMIAWGLLIGCIVLPTACTSPSATAPMTLTPGAQASLAKLCAQDAALQPVAVASVAGAGAVVGTASPTAGVVIAAGAALDQSTLHPLVLDACTKLPAAAVPAGAKAS